jgi:glycosyltransferase involved in cell wall biosynthesis
VSGSRPRVGFVVQRCGDDIVGGAESLCRQTARAMAESWDVEILTTCARDARTWADAYEPGATTIGGVPARRFSVPTPRDPARFDRLSAHVRGEDATPVERAEWMTAQGPVAPDLIAHLSDCSKWYDRVLFYSYLYATTYGGLPPVAARSVLVPLAHREWMLDLDIFDRVYAHAGAFAYVSEEERAIVERRFPGARERPNRIVGVGIESPADPDPKRFVAERGLSGTLFVVVGRVEEAKGTSELIDYFCALQRVDPAPRTLVLVGPVAMQIPRRPDIVALGQVDEREKWDALAAASVVCVPSAFESLSLSALEAWSVGSPVLVNGASAVLIGQCRRSNAGLWYANESEFIELARTELYGRGPELGANGRSFVRVNYTWDRVRTALEDLTFSRARQI